MTPARPFTQVLAELEERDLLHDFTAIAKRHGVLVREMFEAYDNRPKACICNARHECWALLSERSWSSTRIGELFGVHHSSVLAGFKSHERKMAKGLMREIRGAA